MNWITKIFGGAAGDVADKVAGIADKFIQTKEEKAVASMVMPRPVTCWDNPK